MNRPPRPGGGFAVNKKEVIKKLMLQQAVAVRSVT